MKRGDNTIPTDITSDKAKKILAGTKDDKRFFLSNGTAISNYYELYRSLKEMDDAAFSSYVNSKENHFANWILGVFNDDALSSKIRKFKTRQACALVVSQRIKDLNKVMNDSKVAQISGADSQLKKKTQQESITKQAIPKLKAIIKTKEAISEQIPALQENTPVINQDILEKKIPLPPRPKEINVGWINRDKLEKLKHASSQAQPNKNRLYTLGGSLFAFIVLLVTLAGIKMIQQKTITGAVIYSSRSSAGTQGWIAFIVIILLIVIADIVMRKQSQKETPQDWKGTDNLSASIAFREMFEKENIQENEPELDELVQRYK